MEDRASTQPSYSSDDMYPIIDQDVNIEYNCSDFMRDDEESEKFECNDSSQTKLSATLARKDRDSINHKRYQSADSETLSIKSESPGSGKAKRSKKDKSTYISAADDNSYQWEIVAAEARKKESDLAEKKYNDNKRHETLQYQVKLMTEYKALKDLGYSDSIIVNMCPDMKPLTQGEHVGNNRKDDGSN